MGPSVLDNQLFFLINQGCANTLFDMIMPFITSRGYLLLIPYLFVLFFKAFGAERRKEDVQQAIWAIFFCVAAVLLGDWASNELKAATARMRPCEALDGVHLLVGCTKSASMPSNHATNSFAAAVALLLFTRQQLNGILWWYPLAPAALIAFSRVSVGVHYPSDVLAGTVLGSAVAFMLYGAFRLFQSCFAKKPHETILAAVLMSLSLIRIYYVLHGPLDLSPDEAHYWEWARRLDLSYYSKGPAVAYIIAAGTALFGDTVFGVRFFALIFSAFGSILLYRLMVGMYMPQDAADAKGRESAQNSALWGALMLQIVPLFAPFGIILTIDSPFLFCWILGLFLFWRAVQRQAGFRALTAWLLVGLAIGIGLLTKYTMAFFLLSGLLFLLFSEKRALLRTPYPYLAAGVSLVVFLPVIVWNAQHDWVTLRHTAGQAHIASGLQLTPQAFAEFLGSQIGAVTPILFVLTIPALFIKHLLKKDVRHQFLFWFGVPIIVFFLAKSLQAKVQPNWAMTGYITALAAVCTAAFGGYGLPEKTRERLRRFFHIGFALALLATVAAHVVPATTLLPVKLDPSARLRGWQQMGAQVGAIEKMLTEQGGVLIFSDSYQVASELAFYVPTHPKTYCINNGRRMNQYDFWPDMNSAAETLKRTGVQAINGIYVAAGNATLPQSVAGAFERFEKRVIPVYDKGQRPLREYSVFICYGFRGLAAVRPTTF